MGEYSKSFMASFGAIVTTGITVSESFCGTWLPSAVAFLTAVGVLVVPNAKRSDVLR